MIRVQLTIGQLPILSEILGDEVDLALDDGATILDVIDAVDDILAEKGGFPIIGYGSLLHMVYNPIEERFYNQVAITAYGIDGDERTILNIRENPRQELADVTTIILVPEGVCITDFEKPIEYPEFLKVIKLDFFGTNKSKPFN
jgi:hypothetical protein